MSEKNTKLKKEKKIITLSDIWKIIKQNWIIIVSITLGLTVLGIIFAFAAKKNQYRAQSSIIVQIRYESTTPTDNVNLTDSLRYVYTVSDLIVEPYTLKPIAKAHNMTLGELQAEVETSCSDTSSLIRIYVTDESPSRAIALCQDITAAIVAESNDNDDTTHEDLLCDIIQKTMPIEKDDAVLIGPNRFFYIFLSFVIGLVLALVVILIKEFSSTKFKTKEEVEDIGLPVIGILHDKKELEQAPGDNDLVPNNVNSLEPYNRIINSIRYSNFSKEMKTIMITSTGTEEIKSTTIANLAYCCANNGKRVCIIDLDVRKPRIHRIFNVEREKGIVDFFDGKIEYEDMVKHTEFGVDVITCGKKIDNPVVLLESDNLKALFEALQEEYDYIFVDTPPVMVCGDAIVISSLCDGAIYNVAMNQFRRTDVKEAINTLLEANVNVIGLNITKFKGDKEKDRYQYDFHQYYQNPQ